MKRLNRRIVDIVAPAGKIINPAALPLMEKFIRRIGLTPRVGKQVFGDHPFLSNSLDNRFSDLRDAIMANDSEIIICLRGGSGSAELLPLLSALPRPACPKLFIGFSDITALLIFFRDAWQWTSCHAAFRTHGNAAILDTISQQLLDQLIAQKTLNYTLELQPLNHAAQQEKILTAEIIGGNLTVIAHLLGTPYQPQVKDKILLLEDINESAYKVRRALTHLQQANLFSQCQAIVFGSFSEQAGENSLAIERELKEFAAQQSLPVLQTLRIGHSPQNDPIPFGSALQLRLQAQPQLQVQL